MSRRTDPAGFEVLPPELPSRRLGPAGRIGLIALATDNNSEDDLRAMLPPDARLFTTRVSNANPVTADNLVAMREKLPEAAATLVPGTRLDAVIYGCTSATAIIGEAEVTRLVRAGRGDTQVTTPLGAVRASLAALTASRVALLTPYRPPVTQAIVDWLRREGMEVVRVGCMGLEDDVEMAALAPADIVRAGLSVATDGADALFVSCTALPASQFVADLEAGAGMPVIASNQALAWHAMRLAGSEGPLPGPGALMARGLAGEAAA